MVLTLGMMVIMTGPARALPSMVPGCVGNHCEDRQHQQQQTMVMAQTDDVSVPATHKGCAMHLCHAVVIMELPMHHAEGTGREIPIWQSDRILALAHPRQIDRPPNQ